MNLQTSRVNNSRILWIKNENYFYMNTNTGRFSNLHKVPLSDNLKFYQIEIIHST